MTEVTLRGPDRLHGRSVTRYRYLTAAATLEEVGPPRITTFITLALVALLAGAVLWAAFTRLPEAAPATGQILPAGANQVVQHLEGGIVAKLLVDEGDLVEAGQPTVALDATAAASELDQIRAREITLALQIERLRAFSEGRAIDRSVGAGRDDLVGEQQAILTMQDRSRLSQRAIYEQQLVARLAEVSAAREQLASLRRQAGPLREELQMRETLLEKGYMSRLSFLENRRELSRIEGEAAQVAANLLRTEAAVAEAQARFGELDARLTSEAVSELGRLSAELAQVREAVSKSRDRLDRVIVRSPVRGLVRDLKIRTVGGVVQPGGIVMTVVPVEQDLVAEVRISPRDVGRISVGQRVMVRVAAYDFGRFGGVEGALRAISPTTFEEGDKPAYYRATIALDKPHVGDNPSLRLSPGMTVDSEIRTGDRSILEYFLKPVYLAFQTSMHER